MCGIFVFGSSANIVDSQSNHVQNILNLVKNRGPDGFSECHVKVLNWSIQFFGSVLWMQGNHPIKQPAQDDKGNILLWNGDIFDGPMVPDKDNSDTTIVLEQVFCNNLPEEETLRRLSTIKGPYSFVYWNANSQKLWFGRDCLGRHSLLYYFDEGKFILTSVGTRDIPFFEVPDSGILVLDVSKDSYNLSVIPWSNTSYEKIQTLDFHITVNVSQSVITSPVVIQWPVPVEPTEEYLKVIQELPSETLNIYEKLLKCELLSSAIDRVLEYLKLSVQVRTSVQCNMCRYCVKNKQNVLSNESLISGDKKSDCNHPQIGILFSGGVDSTIIAALAHHCIPTHIPIDLFNVAFEKRIESKGTKKKKNNAPEECSDSKKYCVPDRITGIESYDELMTNYPDRQWNFIQINVPKEELDEFRRTRIIDLIHPLQSVLDDSLGCALWFASRLRGVLDNEEYQSPVRILLLGMGADEQFGGYMRHRTTLRHKGWTALATEMNMELERISSRNLGRDDRIVADHGCQARFPFLDENLVNYLSSIPVWTRCYPTQQLPPGVGDKLLLRLVAWKLGLKKAALKPKRAFQFGSRIANRKENASDVSIRLK